MPDTYAKTAHTAGQVWAATLCVTGIRDGIGTDPYMPDLFTLPSAKSVSVAALGGSASLAWVGGSDQAQPLKHGRWDAGPSGETAGGWKSVVMTWRLTVAAPSDTKTLDVHVWVCDWYEAPASDPIPWYPSGTDTNSLSYAVECTVTGLVLCKRRTSASLGTRQSPLDYTDQTVEHTWYAEDDATVSVTGGGLTATGALSGRGAEVNIGTAFHFIGALSCDHFNAANTSYTKISSIECFDHALSMGSVVLYNPGTGDEPSATYYPGWKRSPPSSGAYCKMLDDGGVSLQRSASIGSGGPYTCGFIATAPVTLNYKGDYAKLWDEDGAAADMKVTAEPRDWDEDAGDWVAHEWDFGSDYSQTEFAVTWLMEREWRFLSESGIAQVTQASRVTAGEDVGASTIAENDAQVGILCQPLTGGVEGEPHWGPFIGLVHESSVNVNDPAGAATRPSLWTGGADVTVDGGDNDRWTVATGASAPKVTRTLASRYWLRMARLAAKQATPTYQNADWPYILRRNRAGETATTFGDDPAWWDADTGGVDEEDVWNWSEFSYLSVGITAPKAGTVTLKVTYRVPSIDDPCYTCYEHRYGAEGEFSYSYTERVVTYTLTVASGTNTVLVDLCLPAEHVIPQGDYRLCVVHALEWTLPDGGASPEAWELTALALTLDTGHTSIVRHHNKRAWDWRSACWFGFGAQTDGKPGLQVDPGYKRLREEWGLQYIQRRVHCPDSELTDELDYAKALSRLVTELDWQEGWTATWLSVDEAEGNQDADEIQFAPALYWWDLQHQKQSGLNGAVCTGTFKWAYGAAYDVYYTCYPRGKVCGIAVADDWSERERGLGSGVKILDDDTGAAIDDLGTDAQGWFASSPLWELSRTYRAGHVTGLHVANREYTFATVEVAGALWDPDLDRDMFGGVWRVAERSGVVYCHCTDYRHLPAWTAQGLPFGGGGGYARPTVACLSDGSVIAAATNTSAGKMEFARLRDRGGEWEAITTATIGNGITQGGVCAMDATVHCVGWASDKIAYRASCVPTLEASDLTATAVSLDVCDATVSGEDPTPRSACVALTDGSVLVCVDNGGIMTHYRCRNYDECETNGEFEAL